MNVVADIILGILVVALAIRVSVGFDMGISAKPIKYAIWTVLLHRDSCVLVKNVFQNTVL